MMKQRKDMEGNGRQLPSVAFFFLPLLLLIPSRSLAFGASAKGTSGAQFLQIEPGARAAGMGYAFGGVADDVTAVYYNPAGLGFSDRVEIAGMENQYFQGINYGFAALEAPIGAWSHVSGPKNAYGVLGAAVYNLSVGNIDQRGVTETASPTGSVNSSDFAYGLTYAYQIPGSHLSLGASGKFVTSSLAGYNASSFAGDLGALYKQERFSFGGGIRNMGPQFGFAGQTDPLPLDIYAGGGYHVTPNWLVAAELDLPRDNGAQLSFGTEYVHPLTSKINGAVRGGYATQNGSAGGLSGVTFGVGLNVDRVYFDFAFVPYGDLGNTYQYSLRVKF